MKEEAKRRERVAILETYPHFIQPVLFHPMNLAQNLP